MTEKYRAVFIDGPMDGFEQDVSENVDVRYFRVASCLESTTEIPSEVKDENIIYKRATYTRIYETDENRLLYVFTHIGN